MEEGTAEDQCRRFSIKHTEETWVNPGARFLMALCCCCAMDEKLAILCCETCKTQFETPTSKMHKPNPWLDVSGGSPASQKVTQKRAGPLGKQADSELVDLECAAPEEIKKAFGKELDETDSSDESQAHSQSDASTVDQSQSMTASAVAHREALANHDTPTCSAHSSQGY